MPSNAHFRPFFPVSDFIISILAPALVHWMNLNRPASAKSLAMTGSMSTLELQEPKYRHSIFSSLNVCDINSVISSSDLKSLPHPFRNDNDVRLGPVSFSSDRILSPHGSQDNTSVWIPGVVSGINRLLVLNFSTSCRSLRGIRTAPSRLEEKICSVVRRVASDRRGVNRSTNSSISVSRTETLRISVFRLLRKIMYKRRSSGMSRPTVSRTEQGKTVATKFHHLLTVDMEVTSMRDKYPKTLARQGRSDSLAEALGDDIKATGPARQNAL